MSWSTSGREMGVSFVAEQKTMTASPNFAVRSSS